MQSACHLTDLLFLNVFVDKKDNKWVATEKGLIVFNDEGVDFSEKPQKLKIHMIGHLQTNKAQEAVKLYDVIESTEI